MRFIQVGVGGFGRVWAETLANNSDAEVVGIVDISKETMLGVCEKYGYSTDICFDTLEEALEKVKADVVVSSTPPAFHRHDVVTALKAGLHAISEKPMADNLENCFAMLAAAKETGKTYMVSQNYRYNSVTWTMAEIIRSGKLGKIGQVKMDFYKGIDFGGGFRHEMDYPVIIDMSIHHFDLIRFITGLDALSVKASSWNPSWSNYKGDSSSTAHFKMSDDVNLLYNASWCAKGDYCGWNGNWQIECENGTLLMEKDKIQIVWTKGLYAVDHIEDITPVDPPMFNQAYVLDEFIRNINAGTQPVTCVADNIKSVGMVFATVEAMATGSEVAIAQG
jgi:predicted dehydrogenase